MAAADWDARNDDSVESSMDQIRECFQPAWAVVVAVEVVLVDPRPPSEMPAQFPLCPHLV